jgi:PAS domain S-box-containing protein
VTARIVGEEQVRAADARLRDLLSGIDLGALVLDASGRVEFINDFLLGLMGRSRDELVGQDWIDIAIPEGERAALREILATALASGAGAGQREDGIATRCRGRRDGGRGPDLDGARCPPGSGLPLRPTGAAFSAVDRGPRGRASLTVPSAMVRRPATRPPRPILERALSAARAGQARSSLAGDVHRTAAHRSPGPKPKPGQRGTARPPGVERRPAGWPLGWGPLTLALRPRGDEPYRHDAEDSKLA